MNSTVGLGAPSRTKHPVVVDQPEEVVAISVEFEGNLPAFAFVEASRSSMYFDYSQSHLGVASICCPVQARSQELASDLGSPRLRIQVEHDDLGAVSGWRQILVDLHDADHGAVIAD